MRLVCPNCTAQYEVGDDVIPESGRDVQCSNCGHTWFETPGVVADTPPAPEPVPAHQEPEPVEEIEEEFDDAAAPDAPEDAAAAAEPSRVDPSVAEILNAEAEREEAARAAERGTPMESQTEMGLTQDEARDKETAERIARLKGEEATAAAVAAATRKEMLPDIEEINSTLRSNEERGEKVAPEPEEVEKAEKRGFRTGFFGVLLIVLVLVVLYMFAPQIKSAVPALAGTVDAYVSAVDSGRAWLDGLLGGVRDSMQSAVDANQ